MSMDIEAVRTEAMKQLQKEQFEIAVQTEKERLRSRKPFWQAVFPFEIIIRRRK